MYRYTIKTIHGSKVIKPLGEVNHVINYERKEEDNIRDYNISFKGNLIISGESFHYLFELENSPERCRLIDLYIDEKCGNNWKNIFTGVFSLNDATWDIDNCLVSLIESKQNKYECYDLNKGEEINLFTVHSSTVEVNINQAGATIEEKSFSENQFPSAGDPPPTDIDEGLWEDPGNPYLEHWDIYDHRAEYREGQFYQKTTKWARMRLEVPNGTFVDDSWNFVSTDGTTSIYVKPPNLFNCKYEDYADNPNNPTHLIYSIECQVVGGMEQVQKLRNGLMFNAVIEGIVLKYCPYLTVKSKFFGINEVTNGINYVTGEPSKTEGLVIFQKSDVKRPSATALSNAMNSKWEFIMDNLKTLFNVEWRIEGDELRIEHVSYFGKEKGIDIKRDYSNLFKHTYSYKSEELPRREIWSVKESGSLEFKGRPIEYQACNTGDEEVYNVEITTDVIFVMNNPDADSGLVEDEGLVMVATQEFEGQLYIITEDGILTAPRTNNTLAISHLMRDYHTYERPQIRGIMNDEETIFDSTKALKEGVDFSIPLCCDDNFDPDDYIVTGIGNGIVESATFNLKNKMLDLSLNYPM